jgi:hypothetical protein
MHVGEWHEYVAYASHIIVPLVTGSGGIHTMRKAPFHATPRHVAAPSPPHLRLSHPVPSIRLALSYSRTCFSLSAHHLARPVRLRGDSARQKFLVPRCCCGLWFSLPPASAATSEPCALIRNNFGRFRACSLSLAPSSAPPPPTNHVNQTAAQRCTIRALQGWST